jgi:hypothetical protein
MVRYNPTHLDPQQRAFDGEIRIEQSDIFDLSIDLVVQKLDHAGQVFVSFKSDRLV